MTVKYSKHKWEQIRKIKGDTIKETGKYSDDINTLFITKEKQNGTKVSQE